MVEAQMEVQVQVGPGQLRQEEVRTLLFEIWLAVAAAVGAV
jgi:hypothetical protein